MTSKKKQAAKAGKAQSDTASPRLLDSRLLALAEKVEKDAHDARIANPLRFAVMQDEPEHDLGKRIYETRQLAGITQEQLSKRTAIADKEGRGLSAAVVSLYERGVNKPGPKELRLLCEALRTSPNSLLYGHDDPFGNLVDGARFGHWVATEPEFLAYLTYCFGRLHHHHRDALMQVMIGLLRGWNRDFDSELTDKAIPQFLAVADDLRAILDQRKRSKEQDK